VIIRGENRQRQTPIRPGRYTGSRAVNEHHRVAATGLMIVCPVAAGIDGVPGFEGDLRALRQ
jgi:hypothetical protein